MIDKIITSNFRTMSLFGLSNKPYLAKYSKLIDEYNKKVSPLIEAPESIKKAKFD